jgi:hypothetical protein
MKREVLSTNLGFWLPLSFFLKPILATQKLQEFEIKSKIGPDDGCEGACKTVGTEPALSGMHVECTHFKPKWR